MLTTPWPERRDWDEQMRDAEPALQVTDETPTVASCNGLRTP